MLVIYSIIDCLLEPRLWRWAWPLRRWDEMVFVQSWAGAGNPGAMGRNLRRAPPRMTRIALLDLWEVAWAHRFRMVYVASCFFISSIELKPLRTNHLELLWILPAFAQRIWVSFLAPEQHAALWSSRQESVILENQYDWTLLFLPLDIVVFTTIRTHTHAYVYMSICVYMYICIFVYMIVYVMYVYVMNVYVMYVYVYVYMCMCMCIYIYICICICICICKCKCKCKCKCAL